MATLHKEFIDFNNTIKLTNARCKSLQGSKNELKRKIRKWFKENKPSELQPKFKGQGSFDMNTTVNPIPTSDKDGNQKLCYDLDYGIYFIEKADQNNKKAIDTWHDWVFEAVDGHTGEDTIRKTTCVRVMFADGHHVDLPIYYMNGVTPELAHRSRGWTLSDPKKFLEWFNNQKNTQLEKIVRSLKAWKNYRQNRNSNLKLPSGFELTILASNNYVPNDDLDVSFRETVRKIENSLLAEFKCDRPTIPIENVFEGYSATRKSDFMSALRSLVNDCDRARDAKNFKIASSYLRDNQFGDRFPPGIDKDEETVSDSLSKAIGSSVITPKPYGY